MKDQIKQYIESLFRTSIVSYKIRESDADQIYCVTYYNRDKIPLTMFLISSWDNEEEWKFKIRDAYMECLAIVTGDTQVLRDRYLEDCGEDEDFD